MFLSQLPLPREKSMVLGQGSSAHDYLSCSGMICPSDMAGIAWLPLGLRVVRCVEAYLRQKIVLLGGLESSISGLGASDAVMKDLVQQLIYSHKQLPLVLFQLHNNWCTTTDSLSDDASFMDSAWVNEAYAFGLDEVVLSTKRALIHQVYKDFFNLLGLSYRIEISNNSGQLRHQFYIDSKQDSGEGIKVAQSLVWRKDFVQQMGFSALNTQGRAAQLCVESHVLNISQLINTVVMRYQNNRSMIWPDVIAPFQVMLLPLMQNKSFRVRDQAGELYQHLCDMGFDVLVDDRPRRPGELFAMADLIGIGHQVVISERTIEAGVFEYKQRLNGQSLLLTEDQLISHLLSVFQNKSKILAREGVIGD